MTEKQLEYRRFVGKQIAKKRKAMGFTQAKLGEYFGAKTSTVSSWELGSNPVDTDKLLALSEVLGAPISYFIDDADQLEMKECSFQKELLEAVLGFDLYQQEFALRLLEALPQVDCHDVLFCTMLLTIMKRERAFDIGAFLDECLRLATEREQAISQKVDALIFLRSIRKAVGKCMVSPDDMDEEIEAHIQAIADRLYQRGYNTAEGENLTDLEERLIQSREEIESERELEERFNSSWQEGYDAIRTPEDYIAPSDRDDYN